MFATLRGLGDLGTWGLGDLGTLENLRFCQHIFSLSPHLPVSLSPCLPVSPSPRLDADKSFLVSPLLYLYRSFLYSILRIQATAPFRLHWTQDDWQKSEDTPSSSTALAIYYVDLPLSENKATSIEFTFFWSDSNSWEGRNYQVAVKSD